MRRAVLILLALAGPSLFSGGWASIDAVDPAVRMEQMMIDYENAHPIQQEEWSRGGWLSDGTTPSHLTPYRIHGGVGPASSSI